MASSTAERPGSYPTSPTLLTRLRDLRDRASWQQFHEIYRPLLVAVAARAGLAESDIQDVVQETLIEVARAMPEFRYDLARGRFKNWLLTIVRRRIANHWRAKGYRFGGQRVARAETFEPDALDVAPEGGTEFEAMWDHEWREHALRVASDHVKGAVKPVQFQAFKQHVVKGIAAGEVAHRLGIKLMEVYWAKYRVGKLMKQALAEAEGF